MTYEELYEKVKPYVKAVCSGFSRNFRHITREDLEQECCIKLLSILNTTYKLQKRLSDEELVYFVKKALNNMMIDLTRKNTNKTFDRQPTDSEESEDTFELLSNDWSAHDLVVYIEYKNEILRNLSSTLEQKFFELLLEPDDKLIDVINAKQDNKKERKKAGKFVVKVEIIEITHSDIAKRLAISPATASRIMHRIRTTVLNVLKTAET